MQKARPKQTLKRRILITILLFLVSYFVFLVLWIQVKDRYGYAVTSFVSELIPLIQNVRFEEIKTEKGWIVVTFSRPIKRQGDLLMDILVKTSSYTFNAPLTFGIMAALFPIIRNRWRAYLEALAILLGVHLLYVFSLESNQLITFLMQRGLEAVNKVRLYSYQFLWQFTDNMVIRFEPFLIGFYMFIRFRRQKGF